MGSYTAETEAGESLTAPFSTNDAIRSAQVAMLFRYVTVGVLGALAGATTVCVGLVQTGRLQPSVAAIWLAILSACVVFHILLRYLYKRVSPPPGNWRIWAHLFTLISFAEGITWGFATLLLAGSDDYESQILILLATCGVAAGAVSAFGSYMPAFIAIFVPATLLYLGHAFLQPDVFQTRFAVMDIIFVITIGSLGYLSNANIEAVLRLNIEKDILTENLRREKQRAEEANLAKSHFLASASHDLRQPVHALSLFIGALSSYPMSADMRRLVEHIEESANAMGGLFGSLLDISRIDAGAIQPQLESFELQPLLQRICNDHMAECQAKGNNLKLVSCTATVHADVVLLERILRNLISNAVRYTSNGRILVGCRRGQSLMIEVHDTGCGIPLEEQDRIFDEFYQIKNPERDRSKGLGLGLAIVKRLAMVLNFSIELRSEPGKGTVFKLGVPGLEAAPAIPARFDAAAAVVNKRSLILVVDDEAAIQEGMRSLLSSWGHDILAAGSYTELIELITNCPYRPDLIICDYRLGEGENGIDVIRRLQSEYNDEIPAILITGDTEPKRLAGVMTRGLTILHKPVPNLKLHTAVTSLITPSISNQTFVAGGVDSHEESICS